MSPLRTRGSTPAWRAILSGFPITLRGWRCCQVPATAANGFAPVLGLAQDKSELQGGAGPCLGLPTTCRPHARPGSWPGNINLARPGPRRASPAPPGPPALLWLQHFRVLGAVVLLLCWAASVLGLGPLDSTDVLTAAFGPVGPWRPRSLALVPLGAEPCLPHWSCGSGPGAPGRLGQAPTPVSLQRRRSWRRRTRLAACMQASSATGWASSSSSCWWQP